MKQHGLVEVVLLIFLCILLAGCGVRFVNKSAPGWINGPSVEYPPERFLKGIGQSKSRESAENKAYVAIAKVLRARVMVHDLDIESYVTRDSGSSAMSIHEVDIDRRIEVSTDKVLEDVRIAQNWHDKKNRDSFRACSDES